MSLEPEIASKLISDYGGAIPVRINIQKIKGENRESGFHRARGLLVGVANKKLQIKPFAHSGKIETVDPKHIELWKSRFASNHKLTLDQVKLILEGRSMQTNTATATEETFVIVDTERQTYFTAQRKNLFSWDISQAVGYSGEKGHSNARRSIGQLKRHGHVESSISSWDNLRISTVSAQNALMERLAGTIKEKEKPASQIKAEAAVAAAIESISVVESIVMPPEANLPKAPTTHTEEIKNPVNVQILPKENIEQPAFAKAMEELKVCLFNFQAAVDMCNDEKKKVLAAQQKLIAEISKSLLSADLAISTK